MLTLASYVHICHRKPVEMEDPTDCADDGNYIVWQRNTAFRTSFEAAFHISLRQGCKRSESVAPPVTLQLLRPSSHPPDGYKT